MGREQKTKSTGTAGCWWDVNATWCLLDVSPETSVPCSQEGVLPHHISVTSRRGP
jgi:hypothetical protein